MSGVTFGVRPPPVTLAAFRKLSAGPEKKAATFAAATMGVFAELPGLFDSPLSQCTDVYSYALCLRHRGVDVDACVRL